MIKPLQFKKDKRGIGFIIFYFVILFTILIAGFAMALLIGIIDYGADTLVPITSELGMAENVNMSSAADTVVTPVNSLIQAFKWLAGLAYVVALIGSIALCILSQEKSHPIWMGTYFALIILLIFCAIIISNMYQDLYTANDEIGTRLQEQTLMSYMILYSPFILTLIAFVTGVYLFVGLNREEGYSGV